jgi:hypothetical protein
LANAIVQHLSLTSSGAFEEMTAGSTNVIAETRRHTRITRVMWGRVIAS